MEFAASGCSLMFPAISSVPLHVQDVWQSFTHELHKPDEGIFLYHLADQSALWNRKMGLAASKQLELQECWHIISFMVQTIRVNNEIAFN